MAGREIKIGDVKRLANKLLRQTSDASTAVLERFAELQEKRALRLATAKARLGEHLGEDHPRVVALGRAASSAERLRKSLHATAVRQQRIPKIKQDEWLVLGRVMAGDRSPVSGLRVRVFDKDLLNRDDLLGVVTTDEYGDFAVIYSKESFSHWGEENPDLYVRIEDAEGNLLYLSRDSIRYDAGRTEYFEIILVDLGPKLATP